METIYFNKPGFEEFRFLSNFWISNQTVDNILYQTNEHYYQAKKCAEQEYHDYVANLPKAADTRTVGGLFVSKRRQKAITWLRKNYPDWDLDTEERWCSFQLVDDFHNGVNEEIMLTGLRAKFLPGTQLGENLKMLKGFRIVEWSPWDNYWGSGPDGNGKNRLGELLMVVYNEL